VVPRILVIEDTELVRTMFRHALEDAGYDVVEAADGEEGLEAHRHRAPALVITDLVLPRRGGLSVLREVRGGSPQVPVIVVSGGARDGKAEVLALAAGDPKVRVLQKPVRPSDLLATVKALLGGEGRGARAE